MICGKGVIRMRLLRQFKIMDGIVVIELVLMFKTAPRKRIILRVHVQGGGLRLLIILPA